MQLSLSQLCKYSIFYPKRLAAFRMLTIGKTMQYVFFFITFITIATFLHFVLTLQHGSNQFEAVLSYIDAQQMTWILYPFAFIALFVSNTLLIMCQISLYAAIGYGIGYFHYRIEYRHLWRTAAFAMTIYYILHLISPFLTTSYSNMLQLVGIAITITYILIALRKYPKKPLPAKKRESFSSQ